MPDPTPATASKATNPAAQYCHRLAVVFAAKRDKSMVPPHRREEIAGFLPKGVAFWETDDVVARETVAELAIGLEQAPRLQSYLAALTTYTPSKWLLERELSIRQSDASVEEQVKALSLAGGGKAPPPRAVSWTGTEDVYRSAGTEALTGLCLSGGGIRSATFNLGVLQGLASRGLLEHVDYLSSVSGGGYIHQWLAAWIVRSGETLLSVQEKLIPQPVDGSQPRAPEPIFWLRRYASYLTPQRGVFSADTWTMIAIWFRNTLLNQLVLFSFIGLVLFFFHLFLPGFSTEHKTEASAQRLISHIGGNIGEAHWWMAALSAAGALFLGVRIGLNFWRERSLDKRKSLMSNGEVVRDVVIPGLLLCLLSTLLLSSGAYVVYFAISAGVVFAVLNLVVSFSSGCPRFKNCSIHWGECALFVAGSVATGGAAAFVLYRVAEAVFNMQQLFPRLANFAGPFPLELVIIPPLLFASPFFAVNLQLGILGRSYLESRREWIARLRGWTVLVSLTWLILCGISLLGPRLVEKFNIGLDHKTTWAALLAFVGSHAAALYAGASGKSDGEPSDKGIFGYKPVDLLGIVAAPCAIFCLLVVFSYVLQESVTHVPAIFSGIHPAFLRHAWLIYLLAILLGLFGWRVDINEFSMHGFYRNRLARCYLGASLDPRHPDPFTGFDERAEVPAGENGPSQGGDIQVADLLPRRFKAAAGPSCYTGPFPIFSCTLNLTFGQDLAYQERKGASFAFTPLYSGYHVGWTAADSDDAEQSFNGFVPTKEYAYPEGGVHLATAAAISGAAMSPNQGYSTKASLAFLMTLFNVRLGWWIANPRRQKVWPQVNHRPTPRLPLFNLLNELVGAATDSSDYVYLNDGGKFDNMGLYELVRRRCSFIIVSDAEEDGDLNFDGIAMAIRKCRMDFGAEISLDLSALKKQAGTKESTKHFAVGTIKYPPPPGEKADDKLYVGKVVYIKSSLTGDEPVDVMSYAKEHEAFPHDMTTNQWFTESQFESYRRLGDHIVSGIFPAQARLTSREQVVQLFNSLYGASKVKSEAAPATPGGQAVS
jgi:Patatin-like phospholipase